MFIQDAKKVFTDTHIQNYIGHLDLYYKFEPLQFNKNMKKS